MSPLSLQVLTLNAGSTQWENLGDWSHAQTYPEACRALALRLAGAAGLRSGETVLDLGCGWGEQLAVWRELGAQRVVACEPCPERAAAARACGVAEVLQARGEDVLDREALGEEVDVILALDSAYHIARGALVAGAARALRPGGRLAVATLLAQEPEPPRAARALIGLAGRACGLAPGALGTPRRWRAALVEAGFGDVAITPLDEQVLGGFARYARGRSRGSRRVAATARLCAIARRTGWLGYGVISASRRETA